MLLHHTWTQGGGMSGKGTFTALSAIGIGSNREALRHTP